MNKAVDSVRQIDKDAKVGDAGDRSVNLVAFRKFLLHRVPGVGLKRL